MIAGRRRELPQFRTAAPPGTRTPNPRIKSGLLGRIARSTCTNVSGICPECTQRTGVRPVLVPRVVPRHECLAGRAQSPSVAERPGCRLPRKRENARRPAVLLACRLAGAIGCSAPDRDDLPTCVLGEIRAAGPFLADKPRIPGYPVDTVPGAAATGSGVIAVGRTTAARWPRSGSWRRSGRRPG